MVVGNLSPRIEFSPNPFTTKTDSSGISPNISSWLIDILFLYLSGKPYYGPSNNQAQIADDLMFIKRESNPWVLRYSSVYPLFDTDTSRSLCDIPRHKHILQLCGPLDPMVLISQIQWHTCLIVSFQGECFSIGRVSGSPRPPGHRSLFVLLYIIPFRRCVTDIFAILDGNTKVRGLFLERNAPRFMIRVLKIINWLLWTLSTCAITYRLGAQHPLTPPLQGTVGAAMSVSIWLTINTTREDFFFITRILN